MAELKNLRTESFGVIHIDSRFLISVPISRLYSLLIFYDNAQLHSKPNLRYPTFLSEFTLVSSSGAHHADIEFQEFQASSLFDVTFLSPPPSHR